ncbi:ATP/GTP-binding protein [Streptomyces sp. KN37]|uniref:ATP/GTP-binding protein n=2 Tax=unclassified Streptomyces TaxID=2593676 RepID=UPI002A758ED5|nr:ATP/GTP-binding protein [Streptomyces sp. KN37]WPO71035.1 ATP/GTP-binding protein [Streptomyces sp. KN37]
MDSDGTQDVHGTHATPVPRRPDSLPAPPVGLPPEPSAAVPAPPMPRRPPAAPSETADWLNAPRPDAGPGIWRFRHVPPPPDEEDGRRLDRALLAGMTISLVLGLFVWFLWRQGRMPYQTPLIQLFLPGEWFYAASLEPSVWQGYEALVVVNGVFFGLLVYGVGRLGNWSEALRHVIARREQPVRAIRSALGALLVLVFVWPQAFPAVSWDALPIATPVMALMALCTGGYQVFENEFVTYGLYTLITAAVLWPFARLGDWRGLVRSWAADSRKDPKLPPPPPGPAPVAPRAQWPELRGAGQHQAADVLAAEVLGGRMNDVDCVRVRRGWSAAQQRSALIASFTETVLRQGGAAWTHPSGARDLPSRDALHDLLVGQVRIGRCVPEERNPRASRGAGIALDPAVLGTSLLAVGPSGAGKTGRLIRPVVESLSLQALTGSCAVVAVCPAGTPLGADDAYDVVVKLGDPASTHDLDLYAGTTDPDEAASFLAEGLVGDLDAVDSRRAATTLAQVLGPYWAAYGRFPSVPLLRELLEGVPAAVADLRQALGSQEHAVMRRELDARIRQQGSVADPGPALADRLALLDRPAFADFFGAGSDSPFSLRAVVHHPMRVRIDLPERGHAEASRLLARLLLAQFNAMAHTRADREHFICLVLDDATRTVTAETVRGMQRLRSANAGVVLALRTVSDVPEPLQGPLYATVGCRMAFSGISTWDGRRFAEAWGKAWIETREVAQHAVFADQPMTRALHALRKLVTGKTVTRDAVTVRQVERERWSASELAHAMPPGHAVLSLTDVRGEYAPPLLVDLRG